MYNVAVRIGEEFFFSYEFFDYSPSKIGSRLERPWKHIYTFDDDDDDDSARQWATWLVCARENVCVDVDEELRRAELNV